MAAFIDTADGAAACREWSDRDPPPSAPIRLDGAAVGYVTSAAMGFRTGKRVCLGFVEGRFADVKHGFTIDGYGADCRAERHAGAVYDPDNKRPRS